jgi:hypothetical protein
MRERSHRHRALRNWLKVREARNGVSALFTTREKLPLSTRRVREIFEELGKVGHVPGAIPHRCRHTAASEFLSERPGAEIQLRSRLGQVNREVLSDYISISDPTAVEAAEVASLSTKWNLGSNSGRNVAPHQDRALPAPRGRKATPAAAADDTQALLDRVAADPALLRQLLEQLLKRGAAQKRSSRPARLTWPTVAIGTARRRRATTTNCTKGCSSSTSASKPCHRY